MGAKFEDIVRRMSHEGVLDYAEGICGDTFCKIDAKIELRRRIRHGDVAGLHYERARRALAGEPA